MPAEPVKENHFTFLEKCNAGENLRMKSSSLFKFFEITGLEAALEKFDEEIPNILESYVASIFADASIWPIEPSYNANRLTEISR